MKLQFAAAMFCFAATAAFAENVQLSKMDEATQVYIQRGNLGYNVDCYNWLLADLMHGEGVADWQIYVQYDDPAIDGIGVGLADTDAAWTCEEGELRVWEMGEYTVQKDFRR